MGWNDRESGPLVIHLAVERAKYFNSYNLTCSDNCHVHYVLLSIFIHEPLCSVFTYHPTLFHSFLCLLHSFSNIPHTYRLKIYLFWLFSVWFSADVTFSTLIHFLSFSYSHFPISSLLFANRRTHTHTHIGFASSQQNNSSVATLKLSTSDAR